MMLDKEILQRDAEKVQHSLKAEIQRLQALVDSHTKNTQDQVICFFTST